MSVAEGDEKKPARSPRGRRRAESLDDLEENAGGQPRRAGPEGGFLPDLLRRGLTLGFTGFFMTEEALRRALGDSVPRDWLDFMVGQSEKTRAELLERLSREFGKVISAVDPVEILRRLLDGQTIEVSARIRLANSGRSRRPGREEEAGTEEEEGE
jgi:hypothetical protein